MAATPSTASSLDPQAVNLAKAIRQSESGGNFAAKGKSGEYGAYQFTEPTWQNLSKKYGVNASLDQATPDQQNEVAYKQIKEWKDKGYNVGQIASMWNAGAGEPDAYTGKFSNGQPSIGTNKQGVRFDVPAYAKSVAQTYQQLKAGNQPGIDPNNPSSTAAPQQPQSLGASILGGIGGFLKSATEPVATLLARPYQLAATTLGGQTDQQAANVPLLSSIYGEIPVPRTGSDLVKDVGRAAQTISYGLPVGSLGQALTMGAVAGAGSGLESNPTLGGAAEGALTGAALGGVGHGLSKILEAIPKSIMGNAFKGLNPEQISQALETKSIGTSKSLLGQTQKALEGYDAQISDLLKANATKGRGNNAVIETLAQFPEYEGKTQKLLAKIKSLISAGNTAGEDRGTIIKYIDKIARNNATLAEKNAVRSALDHVTTGDYARLAKAMNPSAGHDIGMTFAHSLRNEVKTLVPETAPIFDEFAKEVAFKDALKAAANKTGGLIRWKDIVPFLTGNSIAGPIGGFTGLAAERMAENPAVQFAGAKIANTGSKLASPVLQRAGLLPSLLQNRSTTP